VIISNDKQLTSDFGVARFFLEPVNPLHRQYEALRAYFVEGLPSAEAAYRFGYTPGAFRVLCHQFRREQNLQERFFREVRHGPQAAPARDPVRELVVAMRKKNLSVYDIQRELNSQGHTISINSLTVLLREEGFARLPRRRDEDRPPSIKPETAEVADVRNLNLAPRQFRTRVAGLFLFVPLMKHLSLRDVAQQAGLPGSKKIPAEQALRSLTRTYRTPRVFDECIRLKDYGDKPIRQLSIIDLGHEEPTILLTNDRRATPSTLITRYAQRMLIENGIAEAIHFFHIDALSSMVGLKVDFDLQLTLMASSLYRLFAQRLPENYHHATAKVLFDSLLDVAGKVRIEDSRVVVTLDKHAHNPYLVDSGLADQPTPMPWLEGKDLVIEFA